MYLHLFSLKELCYDLAKFFVLCRYKQKKIQTLVTMLQGVPFITLEYWDTCIQDLLDLKWTTFESNTVHSFKLPSCKSLNLIHKTSLIGLIVLF